MIALYINTNSNILSKVEEIPLEQGTLISQAFFSPPLKGGGKKPNGVTIGRPFSKAKYTCLAIVKSTVRER